VGFTVNMVEMGHVTSHGLSVSPSGVFSSSYLFKIN